MSSDVRILFTNTVLEFLTFRSVFLSTGLANNRALSEDSSSSIGEVLLSQDNKSSIPLTDSDDMSPPPEPRLRTQLLTHHRAPTTLVESDSVNENFSPIRPHNRR